MSIFSALNNGVSGVTAQSQAIGVISDNIANVNTAGYKAAATRFSTLLQPHPGLKIQNGTDRASENYNAGGVEARVQQQLDVSGTVLATLSPTEIAISGRGQFAVARAVTAADDAALGAGTIGPNIERLTTRQGTFQLDRNGLLRNTAGDFLLGVPVPLGNDGLNLAAPTSINALGLVQLDPAGRKAPIATTQIDLAVALPLTAGPEAFFDVEVPSFTADGREYTMTVRFQRTAAGSNDWTATLQNVRTTDTNEAAPTFTATPVTLTVDPNTQQFTGNAAAFSVGSFTTAAGQTSNPNLNLISERFEASTLTVGDQLFRIGQFQNGAPESFRRSVRVTEGGVLLETFDDGTELARFRIPLVNYVNNNALEPRTRNAYAATPEAGAATLGYPGTSNFGVTYGSAIEQSTTDISTEFSNLIVTQNAYGANTKTITTADRMLEVLTNLAR